MENKKSNAKRKFSKRPHRPTTKEEVVERSKYSKDNDPSWYLVNGQLAKNVANFTFDYATGAQMVFSPTGLSGTPTTKMALPGIMAIMTGPAPGASLNETSPINVAMRNIYSFVRHANSGHANYDPADLMIYLLAADSVQTYWSYLTRIYGTAMAFSQRNRYVGDALLRAQGVKPDSIRSNMAQFLAYINQFALKASVLAVPNTMTYFTRHQWMYQNVYMDEDNAKAQLFLYVPLYLFKYSIMSNGAGGLVPQWITQAAPTGASGNGSIVSTVQQRTFEQLKTFGDDMLNAMLTQEDVGIMSGDILKAYSSDKLFKYAQLDPSYAIGPVFSEEVLTQFHNTNFTGLAPAKGEINGESIDYRIDANVALSVTQDTNIGGGCLIWDPLFANANELAYTKILDLWFNDPTPEQALVAGRNMLSGFDEGKFCIARDGSSTTYSAVGLQSCGSEIALQLVLWSYDYKGDLSQTSVLDRLTSASFDSNNVALLTKFNEYPLLRAWSPVVGVTMPVGDITNYALVSNSEIDAMHNAALLSMFGVPYQW